LGPLSAPHRDRRVIPRGNEAWDATLESKIKSLNIDKRRFKPIPPSRSPEAPSQSFREAS